MIPRILAIAGSDSGGGAGVQADIKTITMLGGHALTAVTAVTAQNTLAVERIMPVPAEMVIAQIDAVVRDIGVDAVKIGMVASAEIADALVERLDPARPGHEATRAVPVVLDPVTLASSGTALADEHTMAALERLMRRATLITPNLLELAALTGATITDVESLGLAAHTLATRVGRSVLAKGGHLPDDRVADILARPGYERGLTWTHPRVETRHSHGTGCTLSSAIACGLGAGLNLFAAIDQARAYVRAALEAAPGLGQGNGPMGHGLGRAHFL